MKGQRSSLHASLFEIIVAVLIFSVVSAVCVRLFVSAKQTSDDGSALSHAVIAAQSAAECCRALGRDGEAVSGELGGSAESGGFTVCYDGEWNTSQNGDCEYTLRGAFSEDGGLVLCHITVTDSEAEELYALTVVAGGGAEQ